MTLEFGLGQGLAVETIAAGNDHQVTAVVKMVVHEGRPLLTISLTARSETGGRLAVSLRPYNPEGIRFVEKIERLPDKKGFLADEIPVLFSREPDRFPVG